MKSTFKHILLMIIVVITIAILLGFTAFSIYVHIKFANVPMGEVPSWAGWIMF